MEAKIKVAEAEEAGGPSTHGSSLSSDGHRVDRRKMQAYDLEIHLLEEAIAMKHRWRADLEDQKSQLEIHKASLESKQKRLDKEIKQLTENVLEADEPTSPTRITAYFEEKAAAENKVASMEFELKEAANELTGIRPQLVKMKKGLAALDARMGELEKKKDKLEGVNSKIHNLKHAIEKIEKKLSEMPELPEILESAPTGPMPLLQAFLVPVDKNQEVPVALHILQNLTSATDKVEENPARHSLVASSGIPKAEYKVASEVGTACALPLPGTMEEGSGGDCLFVVPSVEDKDLEGAFMLHLVATDPIDVEQVH